MNPCELSSALANLLHPKLNKLHVPERDVPELLLAAVLLAAQADKLMASLGQQLLQLWGSDKCLLRESYSGVSHRVSKSEATVCWLNEETVHFLLQSLENQKVLSLSQLV